MGPAVPLLKSLGRKRTLELIMTGEIIGAQKALDMGLINKIVPEADLIEETKKYARKLADKNPVAMQLGKKSFYAMEDMKFEDALELTNYHFSTLCSLDSAQEEVNKFLNKNKK
jgi:enoyl-CoA hydratase/carnithine racemase